MKKIYLLLVVFLPIIAFSQELKVNYNFPENIKTNTKFTVVTEIFKSGLTTFAQYKQVLPKGFTVENIESDGAFFNFEENTINYSWSKLPEDSIIKISYNLIADSTIKDNFIAKGQFSYIVNNLRGVVYTSEQIVRINDNSSSAIENNVQTENVVVIDKIENTVNETVVPKVEEFNCDVKAIRNVKVLNKNEILVEILIDKCNYSGLSIIQDLIPENYLVVFTEDDNCKFSSTSGILSLEISKMPEKEEVYKISYILKSENNVTSYPEISGSYKYLKNNEFVIVTVDEGTTEGELFVEEVIEKTENVEQNTNIEEDTDSGENNIIKFFNE